MWPPSSRGTWGDVGSLLLVFCTCDQFPTPYPHPTITMITSFLPVLVSWVNAAPPSGGEPPSSRGTWGDGGSRPRVDASSVRTGRWRSARTSCRRSPSAAKQGRLSASGPPCNAQVITRTEASVEGSGNIQRLGFCWAWEASTLATPSTSGSRKKTEMPCPNSQLILMHISCINLPT